MPSESSVLDRGSESLCGVWDNGERIPPFEGMAIVNTLLPGPGLLCSQLYLPQGCMVWYSAPAYPQVLWASGILLKSRTQQSWSTGLWTPNEQGLEAHWGTSPRSAF